MSFSTGLAVFAIIIAIVGSIVGMASPASTGISCSNPPPSNPNPCHIYHWNSFPQDFGNTPTTGLFNNDTSYYFTMNMTTVTGFEICAHIMKPLPSQGNATLVLQYFNTALSWVDVDSTGLGSWFDFSFGITDEFTSCSSTLGHVPALSCGAWLGANFILDNECVMRIAGNQGAFDCCGLVDQLTLSQLSVQFFTTPVTARSIITCTATSRSTTQFTNTCGRQFITIGSNSITVAWEANNLGVGFQSGSVTCTINAGASTCTNTVTFAPAFAVAPSVTESWNVIGGSTVTLTPSSVMNLLA